MTFVDFDLRTYELIKSHSTEAGEKYKKDYDERVASLPSFTSPKEAQVEIKAEPVQEVKAEEPKAEDTKEEVDQELIDLQEAYKAKFNKNLSPAVKNNKQRIQDKLNS